jgi:hypothetical protein
MLHQYGKRFLRNKTQRETAKRIESRDAILWDIFPDEKYCRVKIQGSNTLIRAYYPENMMQAEAWLKPGNSVRIQHVGGNRNRVEIVGHGASIPTPTGASMFPTASAGPDAVLAGCKVKPTDAGMYVYIETGTYRIDGTTYTLSAMTAAETNIATAAMGVPIDVTHLVKAIDAASSTLYRFDLLVVGADGTVDLIKGTAASTPTMPDAPTNHVALGWVFIPPDTTDITGALINRSFAEPVVSTLTVTVADDDLTWTETSTTITVEIWDQYGRPMTGTNWGVLGEFVSGNGTLDGDTTETNYTGPSSNSTTFTYERDGNDPGDESPRLKFSLIQNSDVQNQTVILLRDAIGDYMM